MKRHPSLEPFSRDHNDGLILARKLTETGAKALADFRQEWDRELSDHFEEEERLLGPLCGETDRSRLLAEHEEIRALGELAHQDPEARRLGEILDAHIRWEERELFPRIELSASEIRLASLGQAAEALEKRRWKHDSRRATLVARRPVPEETVADLDFLSAVAKSPGPQWGMESEDLNATLLAWNQGEGIADHRNDEVDVLVVVVAGELRVRIEESVHRLVAGQTVLIPKGSSRSIQAVSDRAAHLNIHRRRRKLMPLGSGGPERLKSAS